MIEQIVLPQGWSWSTIGNICRQERTVIKPDFPSAERLPYLGLEHIEGETGNILIQEMEQNNLEIRSITYAFDSRHVLFSKLRPYLNKVATPDFSGRCTTELIPLLPTKCDRQYLAWLLRRPETVSEAMRGKTGSRMPRANMHALFKLRVPLPPLDEQRRIAAIIDEQMQDIEEARRATEAELAAAEALTAAYLRAVFESEEAQGWRIVKLGNCVTIRHGGTPSKKNKDYWIGDVIWVSPKDMKLTVIYDSQDHISVNAVEESSTQLIPPETVLVVARSGILARTLPVSLAGISLAINQDIKALIPAEGTLDPWYLFWLLKWLEPHILVHGVKKGATVHSIRSGFLENLAIPLPNLEGQQYITTVMDERIQITEEMCYSIRARLDTLEMVPAAILCRAFAGEY